MEKFNRVLDKIAAINEKLQKAQKFIKYLGDIVGYIGNTLANIPRFEK